MGVRVFLMVRVFLLPYPTLALAIARLKCSASASLLVSLRRRPGSSVIEVATHLVVAGVGSACSLSRRLSPWRWGSGSPGHVGSSEALARYVRALWLLCQPLFVARRLLCTREVWTLCKGPQFQAPTSAMVANEVVAGAPGAGCGAAGVSGPSGRELDVLHAGVHLRAAVLH